MMQLEKKKRKRKTAFKTILINEVEVIYMGLIVGYGLAYYDGMAMLKPDIVSLTGDTLPEETYLLRFTNDSQLAILALSIQ